MNSFIFVLMGMVSFGLVVAIQSVIKDRNVTHLIAWIIGFLTGLVAVYINTMI